MGGFPAPSPRPQKAEKALQAGCGEKLEASSPGVATQPEGLPHNCARRLPPPGSHDFSEFSSSANWHQGGTPAGRKPGSVCPAVPKPGSASPPGFLPDSGRVLPGPVSEPVQEGEALPPHGRSEREGNGGGCRARDHPFLPPAAREGEGARRGDEEGAQEFGTPRPEPPPRAATLAPRSNPGGCWSRSGPDFTGGSIRNLGWARRRRSGATPDPSEEGGLLEGASRAPPPPARGGRWSELCARSRAPEQRRGSEHVQSAKSRWKKGASPALWFRTRSFGKQQKAALAGRSEQL